MKKLDKNQKKRCRTGKKIMYAAAGIVGGILLFYMVGMVYFTDHFFLNTKINGQDVSGKTVKETEEILNRKIQNYVLNIKGKNGEYEKISSKNLSLSLNITSELEALLKKQNAFLWLNFVFQQNTNDRVLGVSCDEKELEETINSLELLNKESVLSESAYPRYDGEKFVVEKEVWGTEINREILKKEMILCIKELEPTLDLEETGCYMEPKYTIDSEEVVRACELMNQYCQSSITYLMDEEVVLDKSTIATWLSVDSNMVVIVDEEAIREWLEAFGEKYDTLGTTRSFTTPNGKNTTVTGGTYGWSIDEVSEFETILETIQAGEAVKKEPAYYIGGTAAAHSVPDWGNTFVEVDLNQQHMWYIVNGNIIMETDVVTGEPIPEKITPEGVYSILEKNADTVLIGEQDPTTGEPIYRTPVKYWMRVTWEGIGFHDATWQSAFGGTLYQIPNVGSHGCINMPLDQAAILYNEVEVGTPVIIHY